MLAEGSGTSNRRLTGNISMFRTSTGHDSLSLNVLLSNWKILHGYVMCSPAPTRIGSQCKRWTQHSVFPLEPVGWMPDVLTLIQLKEDAKAISFCYHRHGEERKINQIQAQYDVLFLIVSVVFTHLSRVAKYFFTSYGCNGNNGIFKMEIL